MISKHWRDIRNRRLTNVLGALSLCSLLSGCLGIPDKARAIDGFEPDRYLGTWYEIARLDHRFERGLSHVTASYSLMDDGGIRVINKGYDAASDDWSVAEGKAYFIDERSVGRLKVSFFGPFYGAYNIIELDRENYGYALVVGPSTRYLWILARDPNLDSEITARLVDKARGLGFPVEQLIFPDHGDKKTMTHKIPVTLTTNAGDWSAVHDRVMGGVSDGGMVATDSGLKFEGTLSLENNGGFASVRRSVKQSLEGADRIRLRVRGDGRRYQVRLRPNDNRDGVAWRHQFETSSSWTEIELPLDEFDAVFRGRRMSGYGALEARRIGQLGFMLADGTPGPFELEIDRIEFLTP